MFHTATEKIASDIREVGALVRDLEARGPLPGGQGPGKDVEVLQLQEERAGSRVRQRLGAILVDVNQLQTALQRQAAQTQGPADAPDYDPQCSHLFAHLLGVLSCLMTLLDRTETQASRAIQARARRAMETLQLCALMTPFACMALAIASPPS